MAPPCLLEAVEKRALIRLEKDDPRVEPFRLELVQDAGQLLEVVAPADVGDHRGPAYLASLVAEQLAERADHARRQVVDAEVTAVLEGRDRLRLPGARVAGDHDQVHRLRIGDRLAIAS